MMPIQFGMAHVTLNGTLYLSFHLGAYHAGAANQSDVGRQLHHKSRYGTILESTNHYKNGDEKKKTLQKLTVFADCSPVNILEEPRNKEGALVCAI